MSEFVPINLEEEVAGASIPASNTAQCEATVKESTPLPPQRYSGEDENPEIEGLDDFGAELSLGQIEAKYLTGPAGSGKTFEIKRRIAEDRRYGQIVATTGIAAINLDTTTVNACLGYFDTESLKENYGRGWLTRRLRALPQRLVIDEISMMAAEQLDLIYQAATECGKGIVAVGDFLQLPPVKATWAFKAQCWPEFERGTERLTKIWRQNDPQFLDALNHLRSGRGAEAAEVLAAADVKFHERSDIKFDGTTILAKNIDVDRHNFLALMDVKGDEVNVASKRWGKQRGEWKNIPEVLKLKIGAYVMLLTNSQGEYGGIEFVNGDCGHIKDYDPNDQSFRVELVRNKKIVTVYPLVRNTETKDRPQDHVVSAYDFDAREYRPSDKPWQGVYRSLTSGKVLRRRWVLGQVQYFPMRLAYASTVHKSQGLSLDKVQIDVRNGFFGSPAMEYVAFSRCRSAAGLRVVGSKEEVAKRCNVDPEVTRWL